MTYIRPDILIFTVIIHKEGNTSDSITSENCHEKLHFTKCLLQGIKLHVFNHGILTKLISLNYCIIVLFFYNSLTINRSYQ